MRVFQNNPRLAVAIVAGVFAVVFCVSLGTAMAQEFTPEMLEEASRRTGLSKDELLRRYGQNGNQASRPNDQKQSEPGRVSLPAVDDTTRTGRISGNWSDFQLPYSRPTQGDSGPLALSADSVAVVEGDSVGYFGADFFTLDDGLFAPPSFGPVPADYSLGVGDEVVVNVWGALEFQETRIVDRDGSIILPGGGKIMCAGRSLEQVGNSIRRALARRHSTIDTGDGGDTQVEVTLGKLRSIRVYVVGAVQRPGSYELSSVSRMLMALSRAGGPTVDGSLRDVRLVRGSSTVAHFDLYRYLLSGSREGDAQLQEGDTIFVPDVGPSVRIVGEVKRALYYELKPGEALDDLLEYCGGFTARAVTNVVHVKRILPPALRKPGAPDHTYLDILLENPASASSTFELLDGDLITVDAISDRVANYVEIRGEVKRPGRYELVPGLGVVRLVALAGGVWSDALLDVAVIDRISENGTFSSLSIPLKGILDGDQQDVMLHDRDVLEVFQRWENQDRPMVYISGQVHEPLSVEWRNGMTLQDLVLKAGGPKSGADRLRAEVARLLDSAVSSRDLEVQPRQTVEVIDVDLSSGFAERSAQTVLEPWDRVYIRKLPWWENQRTVTVRGEVFYPGSFSLERQDERLSSLIGRAGGLKPGAYPIGARILRSQDDVGNIAIDLALALANPGSDQDIILQDGDEIVIPDRMFTVTVIGEVGFPTSLVYEDNLDIDDYVDMAGGYLENADKDRTRVVWPNGLSLPNKGGNKVVAGSTIIVPVEPPPEGRDTWETIRDITSIVASLATVWLIIDK